MERILERHERYSYADRNLLPNNDTQTCTLEYAKLKARIEVLQKNLRTRPCERKTTNWQRRRELNLELQSYVVVFLWVIESHIHGANYYHLQMQVKEREKDIVSQEAQLGQQQASTIVAQPFQHLDSR
ncbi:hypothetical protein LINPERPRIM_LOCUS27911 [Linum perenne]